MDFKFYIVNAFIDPEKGEKPSGNPAAVVVLDNDVSYR